jgi:hypothetical protein
LLRNAEGTGYQSSNDLENRVGNDVEIVGERNWKQGKLEKVPAESLGPQMVAELMMMVIYSLITNEKLN